MANDTVVYAGAGLEGASSVAICDCSGGCASAPLLLPAASTVRVALPPSLNASCTLNSSILDSNGIELAQYVLNLPQVSWFRSTGATPSLPSSPSIITGAPLRLMGRSLAWEGGNCLPFTQQPNGPIAATVRVYAQPVRGGATVPLPVTFASCYRVDVVPPADGSLATGEYNIRLDNGLRGSGVDTDGAVQVLSSVTIGPDMTWPTATFTVNVTVGCDTITACLAVAGAAGGGTVILPAGTWTVYGDQLYFPDQVALVGAGRGTSIIYWPPYAQTAVAFDPHFPNTSEGEPIISGASPGARWRMSDLSLLCRATGGIGYQPVLGTDFIGLRLGSVGVRIQRVDVTFDLRALPAIQIGNAFSSWGAADVLLEDVSFTHKGSCSSQWPHNCALYVTNSSGVELSRVNATMGCQAYAIESSSRVFFVDSTLHESDVWDGIGSSNGGAEFSTIDAPHVSELYYYGNNSYVGNVGALERWESFTTDGGADSFYNMSIAGAVVWPNGSSTLQLLPPGIAVSVFYYTWAPGDAVAIIRGAGVGQVRRLVSVSPDGMSALIDAAFNPALVPGDSIVSITSYRGGYTFEGNSFVNATCLSFYGGVFDSVVSGNTLTELFGEWNPAGGGVLYPPTATITTTGYVGGGGDVYATSYQQEAYNLWERNIMTCASYFRVTVGFLQSGGIPKLTNTTLNFAQVVRRNAMAGMYVLNMSYTHESVLEHNALTSAYCQYAQRAVDAPVVNLDPETNVALLYRP